MRNLMIAATIIISGLTASVRAETITKYTSETPENYRYSNVFFNNLPGSFFGPRIAWAEPYALGKLKLLVFMPVSAIRDAVELRSRIPAETNLIPMSSYEDWYKQGGEPEYEYLPSAEVLNDTANRLLSDGYRYDAIIIGKVKWSSIPEEIRRKVTNRVRAGTALVFISPWDVDEKFQKQMLLSGPDNPLAQTVKQSVPLSLLPLDKDFELTSPGHFAPYHPGPMEIRAGKLGGGTVVWLDYQDRWMKNRNINVTKADPWCRYANGIALAPFVANDKLFYNYYFSILGKLLYNAAGKTTAVKVKFQSPVVTVDRKTLPAEPVRFSITSKAKELPDCRLFYELRDSRNQVLKKGTKELTLPQGEMAFSPEIPPLAQGNYIVDLWVLKRGMVLDWASAGLAVTDKQYIGKIEPSKEYYKRDEAIAGTVKWKQELSPGMTVLVELWDTYNRLIESVKPEADGSFQFKPVQYPLSRTYRIAAKVMEKDFVADQQEKWVGLPSNDVNDYQFLVWWDSLNSRNNKNFLDAQTFLCKRYGVTGIYDTAAWSPLELNIESADYLAQNNFIAWPYCIGPWGFKICSPRADMNQGTMDEILKNEAENNYVRFTEAYRRYGNMAYCICEECFIDRKEGAWSNPAALKDYRLYLKERYGDINKLNDVWGAKFKDFDEIGQITFAEAKTNKQPTRWLEQELHKVDRFNQISEAINKTVQARDPGAYVSFDCTGGMDYDWPRMAKIGHAFTQCPLESINKERGNRIGTWIGPYTYAKDEWTMRTVPWQYLFQGGTHVIWWYYGMTLDLSEPLLCFKQAAEECRELESGAGKLLLESNKRIDPVIILWSNASYYAGILNPGEVSWEQSRIKFENMLRHIGIDYRAIGEDAVKKELAFGDAQRVLILPNCQSLSRETVERIKAFADAGGLVIADYPPALMDEYLRPYGETKTGENIKFETCGKCKGEKRIEVGNVWQACPVCGGTGQTMKGGAVLTKSALDDVFNLNMKGVKQYGKGYGLYLKGGLDKREQWNAIRQTLIKQAGIRSSVEVLDSIGNLRTDISSYVFDNGRAIFLGLIPDKTINDPPGEMLTVKLGKKYYVYDVRRKQYLGETDIFKTGMLPTEARLFAFLPERIDGLKLDLGKKSFNPGETVELKCSVLPKSLNDIKFAVRIEVMKDNRPVECFTRNIVVQGGAVYHIPLALNQEPGEYQIHAVEVISGDEQTVIFNVRTK